ncbi:MAG: hypothetical protein PHS49_00780 [Candidatus Gracilibacteria bacterium]|nr:hypothetical protein [Candidatus Gracilibacteria bacterium]
MKKQQIKKFFVNNIYIVITSFFILGTVFGAYTSYQISPQLATNTGSYDNVISFTGTIGNEGYYVNNKDNSSIIGNYFKGYYYDDVYGYFKLDWSTDSIENVKIVGSTTACSTGYGYKLGGKAYSEMSGYIDFNYNSNTFVYYCLDDGKLHGKAYGKYIGYQDFEGIDINIVVDVVSLVEKVSNTSLFQNDTTNVDSINNLTPEERQALGGNIIQFDDKKESIFYIIK